MHPVRGAPPGVNTTAVAIAIGIIEIDGPGAWSAGATAGPAERGTDRPIRGTDTWFLITG